MEKVDPRLITMFQFADNVIVLEHDKIVPFEWLDKDEEYAYITLAELQRQLEDSHPCFMVITESALDGAIYRFNNYGEKEWYKVGSMCGYA